MQPTLHATRRIPFGASRLMHAISAWLVKDARDYDRTTTAMHDIEYTLLPPREMANGSNKWVRPLPSLPGGGIV